MRKYPALRPSLYAEEIGKLIGRVANEYEPIDLHEESRRIFGRSGVSMDITLYDLTKMGVLADLAAAKNRDGGIIR